MANNETAKALANTAENARKLIERAGNILEARRNEHYRQVQKSALRVAALENELETYEALEQDWRAAQVRTELAAAVNDHQHAVKIANIALANAFVDYARSLAAAGVSMEAGVNAICRDC